MASFIAPKDLPLEVQKEWYKIRDMFCAENSVKQNIPLALDLALSCKHPDAHWLVQVFAGKNVITREDAKQVLFSLPHNGDGRVMCFNWLFSNRDDMILLRAAARLGYSFAQSHLANRTIDKESFQNAQQAALQNERDGFFSIGLCFERGFGCTKDLKKARENFAHASELGHVFAMIWVGDLLAHSDPQKWLWWGVAAVRGNSWYFYRHFAKQVKFFNRGSGNPGVMFLIGQSLQGHVNEKDKSIFGNMVNFTNNIGPAKQAIAFYEAQINATKAAMHAWTQVGLRYRVVKDIRKLIAALIWNSREEALFLK